MNDDLATELMQTRRALKIAEREIRDLRHQLFVIHDGRFWKAREHLLGLTARLHRPAPAPALPPPPPGPARVRPGNPTILVVDGYLPRHDRESGSLRLFHLIRMMRDLGYAVLFLPHDGVKEEPYATELLELGVEVLYDTSDGATVRDKLAARLPDIAVAWLCHAELYDAYTSLLWRNPAIKVVFDTVDLHFLRMRREWELTPGRPAVGERAWQETQALEVEAAHLADLTVVVTDVEREMLCGLGAENVAVIPNVHEAETDAGPPFAERAGLLFIGGPHPPNVDAVQWLCREVMPLVWRKRPEVTVTLLGSRPAPEVLALASERVRVPGFLRDVSPHFRASRAFVAPLRFGAGMKGKVGQALGHGLPCVLTPVAAEGIGLTDGTDALIAEGAEAFASATLRLYDDEALWGRLSAASREAVRPYGVEAMRPRLAALLAGLIEARRPC